MIALIYIAVVGSLMVSYTKARAEGLGLECKTGLLARPERVVILAIGLLSGTTIWALTLLAILSQVTAIERIAHVQRITRSADRTAQLSKAGNVSVDVLTTAKETSTDNRHLPTTTVGTNEGG
jgi:CDP-diacylglycerol--glycerol-3-phosphate 3-phosphatidyltransferase